MFEFEKITQKTLKKLQDILDYEKFDTLNPCRCVNCFENYESFVVMVENLRSMV